MRNSKKEKSKKMENSREIARYGNFVVKSYGDGQHLWLRICTIDGGWRIGFRDDTEKYAWIMACLGEGSEGVQSALESWIILTYHMANVWPDVDFLREASMLFGNYTKRLTAMSLEKERSTE